MANTEKRDQVWKDRVRASAKARQEATRQILEVHALEFEALHQEARARYGLPPSGVGFELTADEIRMVMDARGGDRPPSKG